MEFFQKSLGAKILGITSLVLVVFFGILFWTTIFMQRASTLHEVEVNAAGQGDRVDATGTVTIDNGASVAVLAEDGDYNGRTDYVIVTGAGGVDGTFGSVTTDLAFLDPLLRYSARR